MITIGMYSDADQSDLWRERLAPHLDEFRIIALDSDEGARSDVAIVWAPPPGLLARRPNLRGIINEGQGVDILMRDDTVPRHIPLVRIVDPDMSDALSHWAILNALDFWRDGHTYRAQQQRREWRALAQRPAAGAKVGVLGTGAIGSVIARRFAGLGFDVRGFARTPREIEGVRMFAGEGQLDAFAEGLEIVVSVLPLTPATRGLMNARFMKRLARGAFIINGGRGEQLVDEDLIAALDSGQVAGAALDVFRVEPLDASHPYWTHDRVRVWPHVAAQTNPRTAAKQVAEAITCMMEGRRPENSVDWERGY